MGVKRKKVVRSSARKKLKEEDAPARTSTGQALEVVGFHEPGPRKACRTPATSINEKTLRNTLDSLLHPMDLRQFKADIYKKRALAVVGGGEGRLAWLRSALDGLDVDTLVERSPSPAINVWMRREADGKNTSFTTEPRNAAECHRCGASLYFRAPTDLEEAMLPAVGADLGMNFSVVDALDGGIRAEIETFISKKGQNTAYHYDYMENITIQLAGRKRWRLKQSGIAHPHRSCATHFETRGSKLLAAQTHLARQQNPDFDPFEPQDMQGFDEVVLSPGDVLYHPAGMWHQVEALSDSVSINLSFMNKNWGEVMQDVVGQLTLSTPELLERVTLPSGEEAHQAVLASAREQWTSKLATLLGKLQQLVPGDVFPDPVVYPARILKTGPTLLSSIAFDADGHTLRVAPSTASTSFLQTHAYTSTHVTKNPLGFLMDSAAPGTWVVPDFLRAYADKAKKAALQAEGVEVGDDDDDDDDEEEEEEEEAEGPEGGAEISYTVLLHASEEGDAALKVVFHLPKGCDRETAVLADLARHPPADPFQLPAPCSPLLQSILSLFRYTGYLRS